MVFQRKGLTEVVATVLIITLTVAGSYTAYQALKQQQRAAEETSKNTQERLDINQEDLRVEGCWNEDGKTHLSIRNSGDIDIDTSLLDVVLNGVIDNSHTVSTKTLGPQEAAVIELNYLLDSSDQISMVDTDGTKIRANCLDLPDTTDIANWGTGSSGSTTITTASIMNDYTYLTSNSASGSATLNVNDGTKFSSGEEVLIIQIQDNTLGTPGNYEFRTIDSTSSNSLTLENSLNNDFRSGSFADNPESTATVTQVVDVPHYDSLTINGGEVNAKEWDGRTGGIVAFRASNILRFQSGGSIDVAGAGFRGGVCGSCGDDWDGGRGEGTTGWQLGGGTKDYSDSVSLNNGIGGGGSHVNNNNGGDPAAGGGHATQGETVPDVQSSYDSEGGDTIGNPKLSNMFFGGGGGAGSDHDSHSPDRPERSDGGGIVFIAAKEIENANINAEGIDGKTGNHKWSGNSGGGAGGTIWVRSEDLDISNINAEGGARSPDAGDGEKGGYGGEGRIRLDYSTINGKSQVTPGPGYEGSVS